MSLNYYNFANWYSRGAKFVAEGVYFDYEHFFANVDTTEFVLIGLQYNTLSAEELIANIRKHDTDKDWTFHDSNDEMRENAEIFAKESKRHYQKLHRYGFAIYDVSDKRELVFDKIIEELKRL